MNKFSKIFAAITLGLLIPATPGLAEATLVSDSKFPIKVLAYEGAECKPVAPGSLISKLLNIASAMASTGGDIGKIYEAMGAYALENPAKCVATKNAYDLPPKGKITVPTGDIVYVAYKSLPRIPGPSGVKAKNGGVYTFFTVKTKNKSFFQRSGDFGLDVRLDESRVVAEPAPAPAPDAAPAVPNAPTASALPPAKTPASGPVAAPAPANLPPSPVTNPTAAALPAAPAAPAPVAPTPPPVTNEPAKPAAPSGLLGEIQQGVKLKKADPKVGDKRPPEAGGLQGALESALKKRRGSVEGDDGPDDDDGDWDE